MSGDRKPVTWPNWPTGLAFSESCAPGQQPVIFRYKELSRTDRILPTYVPVTIVVEATPIGTRSELPEVDLATGAITVTPEALHCWDFRAESGAVVFEALPHLLLLSRPEFQTEIAGRYAMLELCFREKGREGRTPREFRKTFTVQFEVPDSYPAPGVLG